MSYQNQLLGTIISSVLNYDQLCKAMNENPAINNTRSSYAPCDGRSIVASQLEVRANHTITNTPDLRGKFLRGLNVIYSVGQPLPFEPQAFGDHQDNRAVMNIQLDEVGPHTHDAQSSGGFAFNTSGMGIKADDGPQVQFGTPVITIKTSDGIETRPRNVAIYYYIKIN